jgi:hypothetical protein
MAPNLLSFAPAPFHPVPPRFAENRGGGAHLGHKTKRLSHDHQEKDR